MAEYRVEADLRQTRPQSLSGAIVIVILWLLALSATDRHDAAIPDSATPSL